MSAYTGVWVIFFIRWYTLVRYAIVWQGLKQEYIPVPDDMPFACFIAGLVWPSNKNISQFGKRLIRRGFPDVSNFFVFEKAYPSVKCLLSFAFLKKSSTTECVISGTCFKSVVQLSEGILSPSRNFSISCCSAFWFCFLFCFWIFPSGSISSCLSHPNLMYVWIL
jgi:hypothetical protein